MSRRSILPALAALLLALLAAGTAHARSAPLGHAGRWIVDSRGRVLIPHGLNMVNKVRPYAPAATGFGDDDARFLAANGLNLVRLGVIYTAVEPSPGSYDDAYLAGIARTVATLGSHGIYSLLDFHQDMYNERFAGEGFPDWSVQDDGLPNTPNLGFPGNYVGMPALQHAFDHLWANSPGPGGVGLGDRYAAAWGHVAAKFASNPWVIGYDLINEPWPGTDFAACAATAGCPEFDAKLGAFQKRAVRAIRRSDGHHLVWYEPNSLFNSGGRTRLPDLRDPRLGFSFHDYCAAVGSTPCRKQERTVLSNAVTRSRRTGDALLLTEWGATDNQTDLRRVAVEADAALMPWTEWAYCGCQDPTTSSNPPDAQALVLDPARPPTGTNVRNATLHVLALPHPDAVAGTPLSLAAGGYRFSWSTARAAGHGRFPAGSITTIFTPREILPHGYSVSARGARVVSRPGATLLELASLPGATRISVRIVPGARGRQR